MKDSYKIFSKCFPAKSGVILTTRGKKFSYKYNKEYIDTDPGNVLEGQTIFDWDDEVDVVVKGNKLTLALYDNYGEEKELLKKYNFIIG